MIHIEHVEDPRILEFFNMRDHVLHDQNLILAESEKIYLQFIASKKTILKLLCTVEFAHKYSLMGDNVFVAPKNVLEKIAGFKLNYEVIILAEKPHDRKVTDLDNKIILLNGMTSPENVGSIVRSAAAFNVKSIITDEKTCSPYLRRCIRVSMGNIFFMKTHHSKNIRQDLIELKALGYQIISTANLPNAIDLNVFSYPKKCVLIIGSEGNGIDQDILSLSDTILKISIDPQVAHLNAANAAAIFLSQLK